MVSAFTKPEATTLMNQIVEALKPLGVDLNVSFTSAGGRMEGSKCVFKICASKLDADGTVTADHITDTSVRYEFEKEGVNVTGEVIGSIWRKLDGSLLQVMAYHRKRSKYPVEFHTLTDENNRLCPIKNFLNYRQVTGVPGEDFYFWCRVDPDLLSDADMKRFNYVNDWLTLFVPEKQQDSFFTAISEVLETRVTRKVSDRLLSVILMDNIPWDNKIHQLIEMA